MQILILENVRFHKEETKNEPGFAQQVLLLLLLLLLPEHIKCSFACIIDDSHLLQLAANADIFVNDAFGTAHRAHASTEGAPPTGSRSQAVASELQTHGRVVNAAAAGFLHAPCTCTVCAQIWRPHPTRSSGVPPHDPGRCAGVTKYLNPSVAGFLLQKELDFLGGAVDDPKRPFAAIVGGSKVPQGAVCMAHARSMLAPGAAPVHSTHYAAWAAPWMAPSSPFLPSWLRSAYLAVITAPKPVSCRIATALDLPCTMCSPSGQALLLPGRRCEVPKLPFAAIVRAKVSCSALPFTTVRQQSS